MGLDELYFEKLSKDRSESADMLEKPSMRGVKRSVVDKYSDQAHFIYELLQNADDASAISARFVLEKEHLIFAHNGTRLFSISNPDTEESDYENGILGDINSITSIAQSSKTESSIGKFGVGFKAVFQYTETPYIYDPNYRFKIERFIVPVRLDRDFSLRGDDETLFVFPFNHPVTSPKEAHEDIFNKLKSLVYPLLFLQRLQHVSFSCEEIVGSYEKRVEKTYCYDDIEIQLISLKKSIGDESIQDRLWLFSRCDEKQRRYSVGFFIDDEEKLRPVKQAAFCFFPTKVNTNLNFIIHAPFLLTDSREGIRAGVEHNVDMVAKLARLSANAILLLKRIGEQEQKRLIDDSILRIIPLDRMQFSNYANSKDHISFLPFYDAIRMVMEKEYILPTRESFVNAPNAYWAANPRITELISDEQLCEITGNKHAQWAFLTISRNDTRRFDPIFLYLDSLVKTYIDEDTIIGGRVRDKINGIDGEFIEEQTVQWLYSFYKWLSESKRRRDLILQKPIFLDQEGKATAAYDSNDQHILFMPIEDTTGYRVVHASLLADIETCKFLEDLKIQRPTLRDRIYNQILPRYKDGNTAVSMNDFKLLFDFYCKSSYENMDDFIEVLRQYRILKGYAIDDNQVKYDKACKMYLPTKELQEYFIMVPGTYFAAFDEYLAVVGEAKEKYLISFLSELGIKKSIEIIWEPKNLAWNTRCHTTKENIKFYYPFPKATRYRIWTNKCITGCEEVISYIVNSREKSQSVILWNSLLTVIKDNGYSLKRLLKGKCEYYFRRKMIDEYDSPIVCWLKNIRWIVNKNGDFVNAGELTKTDLAEEYDTVSPEAVELLDFLEIPEPIIESEDLLTESQREKIRLADLILEHGYTEQDIQAFLEYQERKKRTEGYQNYSNDPNTDQVEDEGLDYLQDDEVTKTEELGKRHLNKTTSRVVRDIISRTKDEPSAEKREEIWTEEETDSDDYTPSLVDYSKKIERAKQRSAEEIDRIAYLEILQEKAQNLPRYSYGWFKTLLELESLIGNETNTNNREISICFAKVELEPGTKRTLVLKHPSRYIPQFMEDLADVPLILQIGNERKTIAIEVASIKSYTLRVKLKSDEAIHDINLEEVTQASITARSPAFLLEELRKQFGKMNLSEDFDMQKNLVRNIEFVFGPPGTGKTTYLANKVILPLIEKTSDCRILVLTPTNKAADVLTHRIMEVSSDASYEDWLVRFGITGDEELEQSPVFRDKSIDIRELIKSVTITTIARFPYDFFMPNGERLYLNELRWDYIIIDEASMIPLINIIYPIYKKTPIKFVIAGDPFQIEPITAVDLWRNENIYTLVKLDSFIEPKTFPHKYKVELLTTQYRSIPEIGEIYSKLSYGGVLQHYRKAESRKKIILDKGIDMEPLNIIKFPVSKYESIYRAKKLHGKSAYQIYAALFTHSYVCYLSDTMAMQNPGMRIRIGVIAPYRAQADLIDKLLASSKMPEEIEVQVGTIHGFQGDECDIIFAVFNTPPSITDSKEMFLNKCNIINVSISRAKDYLFILMPDDNTENVTNLKLIKRVEGLIKCTDAWTEKLTPDLEQEMFGDKEYLENNSFSTGHQSVNVYGIPEKCYEIRSEDDAVDIQVHYELNNEVTTEKVIVVTNEEMM